MEKKISDIMRETRESKGFNKSEMARQLGIASQLYGKYEDGKIEPKTEFRTKFKEIFGVDLINIETKGSTISHPRSEAFPLGPIDDEVTETTKSGNEFIDIGGGRYAMLVPLVHEYAYGGYLVGFRDPEYMETLPRHTIIVNEKHRGEYCAFKMRGDSMNSGQNNSIEAGDTVVGRNIPKQYWQSKLHIHRYREYVIVHKEGILVKEIIAHDIEKGVITIHSYNPDKVQYPDEQISLADVGKIYNVVEVSKPRK